MNRHEFDAEVFVRIPGWWVFKADCWCGFPFIAKARKQRNAQVRAWRKYRDHRGFAAAAGPGWVHH